MFWKILDNMTITIFVMMFVFQWVVIYGKDARIAADEQIIKRQTILLHTCSGGWKI